VEIIPGHRDHRSGDHDHAGMLITIVWNADHDQPGTAITIARNQ
jgi:hypothetical protein